MRGCQHSSPRYCISPLPAVGNPNEMKRECLAQGCDLVSRVVSCRPAVIRDVATQSRPYLQLYGTVTKSLGTCSEAGYWDSN